MKTVKVLSSPHDCDDGLPWEYEEDGFIAWVDEVFFHGYKKPEDAPFPTFDECINEITTAGYDVEVTE